MKVKDRFQKKFLRAKDPVRKDALHNEVKQYRSHINILTRGKLTNINGNEEIDPAMISEEKNKF